MNDVNSNFATLGESVSNGKTLVANAITTKGVSTSTSASFETMATNIGNIKTGVPVNTKISMSAGDTVPDSKTYTTSLSEISVVILHNKYNDPEMVWVQGHGTVVSNSSRHSVTNVSGGQFSFKSSYGGWTGGTFVVIGK